MKRVLTNRILSECPNITFQDRGFGFECGDGWFEIVSDLMHELNTIGKVEVSCLKEKYGTLRVYASGPAGTDEAIRRAEARSYITCERCGHMGQRVQNGNWLRVACEAHIKPGDLSTDN